MSTLIRIIINGLGRYSPIFTSIKLLSSIAFVWHNIINLNKLVSYKKSDKLFKVLFVKWDAYVGDLTTHFNLKLH